MEFKDKVLVCKDCAKEFTFTASEQEFYKSKGFENEPTRCQTCRSKRKANNNRMRGTQNNDRTRRDRQFFKVNCSDCGKETEVPFKPVQGKPVLCRNCYQTKNGR